MQIRYSKDHVWIRADTQGARIGLSDFAQSELGEIVFVETPEKGKQVAKGDPICSIDALKSTSDIYAPVAGRIIEVNEKLAEDNAKIINADPLGEGWICRMSIDNETELEELMTEEQYREFVR